MLRKTIVYNDFNGQTQTEDFYFNLTEAEITELELSENGGYTEWVRRLVNTRDQKTLAKIFRDIICKSYGEKSTDGKRFVKIDRDGYELWRDFIATDAYSKLYMELITDAEKAADFMRNVIPADLRDKMDAREAMGEADVNANN